jgi:hypothetical protein
LGLKVTCFWVVGVCKLSGIDPGVWGVPTTSHNTGLDLGYLEREKFEQFNAFGKEAARYLGGLMRYLNQSALRGRKFKKNSVLQGTSKRIPQTPNFKPQTPNSKPSSPCVESPAS